MITKIKDSNVSKILDNYCVLALNKTYTVHSPLGEYGTFNDIKHSPKGKYTI
jgi:hypothetical protein